MQLVVDRAADGALAAAQRNEPARRHAEREALVTSLAVPANLMFPRPVIMALAGRTPL